MDKDFYKKAMEEMQDSMKKQNKFFEQFAKDLAKEFENPEDVDMAKANETKERIESVERLLEINDLSRDGVNEAYEELKEMLNKRFGNNK